MMELHARELLLGGLKLRREEAARVGADLHELQGLVDVSSSWKHCPLHSGQIE